MSLSQKEKQNLDIFLKHLEDAEMAQVHDMIANCNISFQFAKTHSVLLKDWEKTKQTMEDNLAKGILPEGATPEYFREIIMGFENIMEKKLRLIREAFAIKFGESIYNYLGEDGKTKKLFGLFG